MHTQKANDGAGGGNRSSPPHKGSSSSVPPDPGTMMFVTGLFEQLKSDAVAAEVIDGLYVGSLGAALHVRNLKERSITHILSLVGFKPRYPKQFNYKVIDARDVSDFCLYSIIPECFGYIEHALETGGRVLVHCFAGKSRSASIILAYLMWKLHYRLSDAFESVRRVRRIAEPNLGFVMQLRMLDRQLRQARENEEEPQVLQHIAVPESLHQSVFARDGTIRMPTTLRSCNCAQCNPDFDKQRDYRFDRHRRRCVMRHEQQVVVLRARHCEGQRSSTDTSPERKSELHQEEMSLSLPSHTLSRPRRHYSMRGQSNMQINGTSNRADSDTLSQMGTFFSNDTRRHQEHPFRRHTAPLNAGNGSVRHTHYLSAPPQLQRQGSATSHSPPPLSIPEDRLEVDFEGDTPMAQAKHNMFEDGLQDDAMSSLLNSPRD